MSEKLSVGSCQPISSSYLRYESFRPKWYFTKEELDHSPSRSDGISSEQESHLRQLFCSYLQELGIELRAPQVTIATAMMLCHRFYMHQSHSKNHWQAIANSSMFLASKAEDTPCRLKDVVVTAYKLMYKWDPSAPQRIREKEFYDKQKELIITGERLVLATVAFDLNIEHPYKPLVAALKKLKVSDNEVVKVAWNFVNDWVRTTLCLQYKPDYIAAGSLYLAVKFQKKKLPSQEGNVWWMQFDVAPKELEEVIQHMLGLLGKNTKQAVPTTSSNAKPKQKPLAGKEKSNSAGSCISSDIIIRQDSSIISSANAGAKQLRDDAHRSIPNTEHRQISGPHSADSVVDDCDHELLTGDRNSSCKTGRGIVLVEESYQNIDITTAPGSAESCISSGSVVGQDGGENALLTGDGGRKSSCEIDISRIRERIKRRKLEKMTRMKSKETVDDEEIIVDSEAWIERQLEEDIELVSGH